MQCGELCDPVYLRLRGHDGNTLKGVKKKFGSGMNKSASGRGQLKN